MFRFDDDDTNIGRDISSCLPEFNGKCVLCSVYYTFVYCCAVQEVFFDQYMAPYMNTSIPTYMRFGTRFLQKLFVQYREDWSSNGFVYYALFPKE